MSSKALVSKFKSNGKTRKYLSGARGLSSANEDWQESKELINALKEDKNSCFYVRPPRTSDSEKTKKELAVKKIDVKYLMQNTSINALLFNKSIRNLVNDIVLSPDTGKLDLSKLKIVFDDKVYSRNPKNKDEETDEWGHFNSTTGEIVLSRLSKRCGENEKVEDYKKRMEDENFPFGKEFNTYTSIIPIILTHEIRHAWQHKQFDLGLVEASNMKSFVMKHRIIEADATAFSALAMWEFKNSGYGLPYFDGAKDKSDGDIFKVFENAIQNRQGNSTFAAKMAFIAWYESTEKSNRYPNFSKSDIRKDDYEQALVRQFKSVSPKVKDGQISDEPNFTFKRDIDLELVLKKLSLNGSEYLSDVKQFIQKEENIGIRNDTAQELKGIFSRYERFDETTRRRAYEQIDQLNTRGRRAGKEDQGLSLVLLKNAKSR